MASSGFNAQVVNLLKWMINIPDPKHLSRESIYISFHVGWLNETNDLKSHESSQSKFASFLGNWGGGEFCRLEAAGSASGHIRNQHIGDTFFSFLCDSAGTQRYSLKVISFRLFWGVGEVESNSWIENSGWRLGSEAKGEGKDFLGGVKQDPNAVQSVARVERENFGATRLACFLWCFLKVQPSAFC